MKKLFTAFFIAVLLVDVSGILFLKPQTAEAAATVTFLQYTETPEVEDVSTHTFPSQNLGTAAADRIIFVLVSAENGTAASYAMTIAGITATRDVVANDTGNNDIAALFWAHVPTGTSGTIVLETGVESGPAIGVYRATGIGTSLTPFDTATNLDDVVSMTIDVPEGGILLANAAFEVSSSGVTTIGVNEDYDDQMFDAGGDRAVGGASGPLSAETNRTVSFNGATGNAAGVAASYSPAAEVPADPFGSVLSRPPNNLGLVGYWSFNEGTSTVATDFSGNGNHGALQNTPAWVSGKRGKALQFVAADSEYVQLANSTALDPGTGGFSVSAWFRTSDCDSLNSCFIYNDYGTSFNAVVNVQIDGPTDIVAIDFRDNTGSQELNLASGFVADGSWHHLVAVRETQTTARLYIDGVSVDTDTNGSIGTITSSTGNNPLIGAFDSGGPGSFFNGTIDEVRLYNRMLTAGEVAALARSGAARVGASSAVLTQGSSLGSGLVGHWTFDGADTTWSSPTAGTTRDRSGNNNTGTLTNMNRATAPAIGKLGQAFLLDGINDYVSLPNAASLHTSGDGTVAMWFKGTTDTGGILFSANQGNDDTERYFEVWVGNGVTVNFTNELISVFYNDNGGYHSAAYTTANRAELLDGAWHHIVLTSGTSTRIYLDGVSKTVSVDGAATGQFTASAFLDAFRIGNSRYNGAEGGYLTGSLDDVRVYNRVLTPDEVRQLFNLGQVKIRQ